MGIDHFREREGERENGVGLIWNKVRNTYEVDQARERRQKKNENIKEKRKEKTKEKAKKGC